MNDAMSDVNESAAILKDDQFESKIAGVNSTDAPRKIAK